MRDWVEGERLGGKRNVVVISITYIGWREIQAGGYRDFSSTCKRSNNTATFMSSCCLLNGIWREFIFIYCATTLPEYIIRLF